MADTNRDVLKKIGELYRLLFEHDGYGEMSVEMRILKRNQKEVIVRCGCQHRYVVDWKNGMSAPASRQSVEHKAGEGPVAQRIEACNECSAEGGGAQDAHKE
jgi:hypothetical protein